MTQKKKEKQPYFGGQGAVTESVWLQEVSGGTRASVSDYKVLFEVRTPVFLPPFNLVFPVAPEQVQLVKFLLINWIEKSLCWERPGEPECFGALCLEPWV